jgi:PAS domain S-box-containing protein
MSAASPPPDDDAPRPLPAETRRLLALFEQSPGFLAFLSGPTLVYQLANAAYAQLVGHRELLGKPIREALPEVAGQGYFERLERVYATGVAEVGRGERVLLQREPHGPLSQRFVDFIFQPIRDEAGAVAGLLVQGQDVTEAKQHEERIRTLFEGLDDGYCLLQLLFDAQGRASDYRFLEANAAFARHTGLVGAVGRTARELVPDLDASWFRRYGEVALTGVPERFESPAPAMDRTFEVHAVRVGAPEARQVALVFRDVTARKQAEEALRQSEERAREAAARVSEEAARAERERALLDAVLAAAPAGIIVADAQGRILRTNPANERLWGLTPQSASVDEYREWRGWWADGSERHGRPIAPGEWAMARALRGEVVPGDLVSIEPFGAPGRRRVMMNSASPVRDAQGAIVGAVVAQADLTALAETEARLQAILDASPSVIYIKDREGRYQLVNRAFLALFGRRREDVLGQTDEAVAPHPALAAQWRENDRRVLDSGEPVSAQEHADRPDGEVVYLSVKFPLRNAEGRVYALCGISSETSELRRAERERERLAELQERMVGIFSHDVRSPLSALLMSAQSLRRKGGLDPAVHAAAERIERSARRVEHVVRLMLDFTRTRLGLAIPVEGRPVDLAALVREVAEELQTARPERRVVLAGGPAACEGDPDRLFQALANLLENAFKYGEPGGPVTVTTGSDAGGCTVAVHNRGEPIPEELLERLFRPFSRGAQTEETVKLSLGLGLFIVDQLARAHGGEVTVRSTRAEGTTFTLRLPPRPPAP